MSSLNYNLPPTYATAFPSPDYSRDPNPTEQLVESSISPPPYITEVSRVTSVASTSSGSTYSDYGSEYGSSRAGSSGNPPVIPDAPMSRYVYTTGNVELDLGEREEGRAIPSYGRQGLIRGVVRLKKFSHVQSIVITVSATF